MMKTSWKTIKQANAQNFTSDTDRTIQRLKTRSIVERFCRHLMPLNNSVTRKPF